MKFLAGILMILFLSACAGTGGETRSQNAKAHYQLGVGYLSENKVQQAFVEFHTANELNPNDKEVLNAIGVLYLVHLDDPQKAVSYFEKAVKEDPDYSEAYNNLGYAYAKLGNHEKAIPFYKKALANPMYPTAEKAYLNMGDSYYRLGRYESALSAFKEAIMRAPGLSLAYMRLALCYNAMDKFGDAASALSQAIKIDSAYKGSREKFAEDMKLRKLKAKGYEEKDIRDYLEILKY